MDFAPRVLLLAFLLLAAQGLLAATNLAGPDEIPPLRPAHGEMPPTFREQYGAWVIAGGAVLVGLVCAGVWLLTRPKPGLVVPPEVAARKALEWLREKPEDGALLSQVSQVLRQYVAAVFALPPGEMTTAEFCRAMAGQDQVGPELSAALGVFLRQCDERKFSPPAPAPPLGAVEQALKLLEQAEARRAALRPPAGQPTGGAEASPAKSGTGNQAAA